MRPVLRVAVLHELLKARRVAGADPGQLALFGNDLVPKRVVVPAHTRQDGTHVQQHATTVYVHPNAPVAVPPAPAVSEPAPRGAPASGDRVHRVLATSDGRHVGIEGVVKRMPSGAMRVYVERADRGTPSHLGEGQSEPLSDDWVHRDVPAPVPALPTTIGPSANLSDAMARLRQAGPASKGLRELRHIMGMFEAGAHDLPDHERTAVYGIVYAMETGRLEGATQTAINRLDHDGLSRLIVRVGQGARVISDVPHWLNEHHAEIKAMAAPPAPVAAQDEVLRRVKNAAPRDEEVRNLYGVYRQELATARSLTKTGSVARANEAELRAARALAQANDLVTSRRSPIDTSRWPQVPERKRMPIDPRRMDSVPTLIADHASEWSLDRTDLPDGTTVVKLPLYTGRHDPRPTVQAWRVHYVTRPDGLATAVLTNGAATRSLDGEVHAVGAPTDPAVLQAVAHWAAPSRVHAALATIGDVA